MSIQFRKAIRQNVNLIVALGGGTGAGKTKSGFLLAAGLAGGKTFAVIDTENGRARHYAPKIGEAADGVDTFDFECVDLRAPFDPASYAEAIKAADAAGYPVIMVDSMSHEHAGDGGLLDMSEAELDRMAGDNWEKRNACLQASWIKPKKEHKRMMQALVQVKAHLILCFRAEEKTEMKKVDGKWQMVPKKTRTGKNGWVMVCEKNIPFEATCSFLLTDEAPGVPQPIKLQAQHKAFFPLDKEITAQAGQDLAAWAAGGAAAPLKTRSETFVSLCDAARTSGADILKRAGVQSPEEMNDSDWADAAAMLKRKAEKVKQATA